MAERISVTRGDAVTIEVDGKPVQAHAGETVATAMLASAREKGSATIRASARHAMPRGVFCNMGICYECLVYLDGRAVRACMTPVRDGMQLTTWGPEGVR